MSLSYEVVVGAVGENAQAIADVWSNSFESLQGDLARQKLEHSYLDNPAGAGPVFLLRDADNHAVVGVQCLVLRHFYFGGRRLVAGIMADYAVNAAHRSLGPALQLLKSCIADSRTKLDLLYGLPNHKAEAVTRRAGLEVVRKLGRYASPLRIAPYLPEGLPAFLRRPAGLVGDFALAGITWWLAARFARRVVWQPAGTHSRKDLDMIWGGASGRDLMLSERSSTMLDWRFRLPRSSINVHTAGAQWYVDIACDAKTRQPIGYVVWLRRDDVSIVGDFLCADPIKQTTSLLVAFRRRMRALGVSAISVEYCGSPAIDSALAHAGFSLRESSPLCAVRSAALPPVDHWYFTSFDRDTD